MNLHSIKVKRDDAMFATAPIFRRSSDTFTVDDLYRVERAMRRPRLDETPPSVPTEAALLIRNIQFWANDRMLRGERLQDLRYHVSRRQMYDLLQVVGSRYVEYRPMLGGPTRVRVWGVDVVQLYPGVDEDV
jgi:hypothetical protein